MSYSVYVHTNRHNGKKYVGITSRKPEERWDYGGGYCSNKPFYNAIRKYGWHEGFDHEVVATGLTAEDAAEMERALIKRYKSNDLDYGYNLTAGGFGYDGLKEKAIEWHLPDYWKIKQSGEMRALFDDLLSIAYGGRVLKDKVRMFKAGEPLIFATIKRITSPNLAAIDALIEKYRDEPELQGHIKRLIAIQSAHL